MVFLLLVYIYIGLFVGLSTIIMYTHIVDKNIFAVLLNLVVKNVNIFV